MKYKYLIDKMTLEEKASLMSGLDFWHTKPVERLGIPSMMMTDGPHGLRKQLDESDHLGLNASVPATCYPTASAAANSWDEELLYDMGRHLGTEAVSEGVGMVLGPGVNIKRSPLCGRSFEYYSEDPFLAGKCAAAVIRGIQSNGVYACVKHFAANSQELLRMSSDSVLDERTLREIYLPAFELAVKEGGTRGLMTSYNMVNGEYANENTHLLREILRGEWGYDGLIVSDWGGNCDRVRALAAGSTLEMPSTGGETDRQLVSAVKSGELDEAVLDGQVDILLDMVFSTAPVLRERKPYDKSAHHLFARDMAEKCAVLLKNENGILPLSGREKLAVIGEFAEKPRFQGAGSSFICPTKLVNALEALKNEGVGIIGYEKGFAIGKKPDLALESRAAALAEKAETVLLFLGLDELSEAEGIDRSSMRLPDNQVRLIKKLRSVNKNIVVLLSCGSPVEMEWDDNAAAVLHCYLGGQAGAEAAVRLVLGRANPSGKLAETIPVSLMSVPSTPYFPGREATAEYREGIYVGYRYYLTANKKVKYPFGYGLSYTTFEYSDLRVDGYEVSFTVKNTGTREGAEIAQLYISANTGGVFRAKRELKGLKKLTLAPGESAEAVITLDDRSFSYWNTSLNRWVVEEGSYTVGIGASCEDIRLEAEITLAGESVPNPYAGELFAPYHTADIASVPDESFRALLGRDIPPHLWQKDGRLGFNSAISQGARLPGGMGRALYDGVVFVQRMLSAVGAKRASVEINFVLNMPYRGFSRLAGIVSDDGARAIVACANREKGAWKALAGTVFRK